MHELTTTADPGQALTGTMMLGTAAAVTGIALTETAQPGYYVGSVPANTAAGRYRVLVLDAGGEILGAGELVWGGNEELPNPPGAPSDVGLCRVYGYLETPDNRVVASAKIIFDLMPKNVAIASERLIGSRQVTVLTNEQGQIIGYDGAPYVDLQRTDILSATGGVDIWYELTSDALSLKKRKLKLEADTLDLRTVLLAPVPI